MYPSRTPFGRRRTSKSGIFTVSEVKFIFQKRARFEYLLRRRRAPPGRYLSYIKFETEVYKLYRLRKVTSIALDISCPHFRGRQLGLTPRCLKPSLLTSSTQPNNTCHCRTSLLMRSSGKSMVFTSVHFESTVGMSVCGYSLPPSATCTETSAFFRGYSTSFAADPTYRPLVVRCTMGI